MPAKKVPTDWRKFSKIGNRIPGTPFICFKVPIQTEGWNIRSLKEHCGEDLTRVIDLTNTDKYYKKVEMERALGRDSHVKIPIRGGGVLPSEMDIDQFCDVVNDFYVSNGEDKLLGVHDTYGHNRSGYLVCCYMFDWLEMEMEEAIEAFNRARGETMYRANYLAALRSRRS